MRSSMSIDSACMPGAGLGASIKPFAQRHPWQQASKCLMWCVTVDQTPLGPEVGRRQLPYIDSDTLSLELLEPAFLGLRLEPHCPK
jgi:hypothetical protein